MELQLQLPIALEAAFAPPPSRVDGGKRRCGKARRGLDPSHGTLGGVRWHGGGLPACPGDAGDLGQSRAKPVAR